MKINIGNIKFGICNFFISFILYWILYLLKVYTWINMYDNIENIIHKLLFFLLIIMCISSVNIIISLKTNTESKQNISKIFVYSNFICILTTIFLSFYLFGLSFLLIFFLIIAIIILFDTFINKKNKLYLKNSSFLWKKTILLSIIIILVIQLISIYKFNELCIQKGSFTYIISKEKIGDKYFFSIPEIENNEIIMIYCNEKTYDKLIIDKNILYTFEYRTILIDKKHGFLVFIDTENALDNR